MPWQRDDQHPDEPGPQLQPYEFRCCKGAPRQTRPEFIRDREIHDHDRAAVYQVEMAGDPLRVVNGRVQDVTHVDEAAGPAKSEHDHRKPRGEYKRTIPGQGGDPSEQTPTAA